MKTPMEIFKKHGAHYYENDEQAIIDAMTEYAEQQVKNLNIPAVIKSVCDHPWQECESVMGDGVLCRKCNTVIKQTVL